MIGQKVTELKNGNQGNRGTGEPLHFFSSFGQSARLSAGGVQSLFGQCPNVGSNNMNGCFLSAMLFLTHHLSFLLEIV